MAFYDWNRDGKKDVQDDFIEYNIYKESTKSNDSNHYSGSSGSDSSGCLVVIAVIGIILFVANFFSSCTASKCKVAGCTNECTSNSSYCLEHDFWDRHYNNPTHYDEYNERKREEKATESKTEEKSTYTPSKKSGTSSNYNGSAKSYDDPYDVNEYYSAEDFYDDNYDDFWDYEEAEDYYNSYYED